MCGFAPSTCPDASATGAPSSPGYRPPSRRIRRSTRPPRQVRHSPATRPMWPKLACVNPDGSRPTAQTASPTRGLAPAARPATGRVPLVKLTAARSEPASTPRTVPCTCSPSGSTSETLDSRHSADALPTTTPSRHSTPEPLLRRVAKPTTEAARRSTVSAREEVSGAWVMGARTLVVEDLIVRVFAANCLGHPAGRKLPDRAGTDVHRWGRCGKRTSPTAPIRAPLTRANRARAWVVGMCRHR